MTSVLAVQIACSLPVSLALLFGGLALWRFSVWRQEQHRAGASGEAHPGGGEAGANPEPAPPPSPWLRRAIYFALTLVASQVALIVSVLGAEYAPTEVRDAYDSISPVGFDVALVGTTLSVALLGSMGLEFRAWRRARRGKDRAK